MSLADKLTTVAENVPKVYQAGKDAEYNTFWDAYQNNGNMTGGYCMFYGSRWNNSNFKPKYNIVLKGSAQDMFNSCGVTDFEAAIGGRGLIFDTSGATNLGTTFAYANFYSLPEISTIGATKLVNTFTGMPNLHTISKLVLKSDGSQTFTTTFKNTTNLQNILIEGVIGTDITFEHCTKLTKASLLSIINALKTFTSGTHTLTIGETNKAKLTADEIAVAEGKGWTVA